MATNESIVELIKFASAGVPEILADVGKLDEFLGRAKKAATGAAESQKALAGAMADAKYREQAGSILATEQATRRLNELTRRRLELETRRQFVTSGAYVRDYRASQVVRREQERIFELERRALYQARFGRFGGGLAYHADRLSRSRAGQMAVAAGVTTTAMAMSGFSGTVEGNRLQLELQMISRELAGAFKPAIEFVTKALQGLRKGLERLGPNGQDAIAIGMGGLGLLGMYRSVGMLGRMAGVGGATAAAAGGGGLGAAAAGGGLGLMARRGLMFAGGVGLGAAAHEMGVDTTTGMLGAGALGLGHGALTRTGGTALKAAGRFALPVGIGMAGADAVDMYGARRDAGESRLGAGLRSAAHGLTSFATLGMVDLYDKPGGRGVEGPNKDRRMVTIADSGFEAPGSAFERITNKLALVDAEKADGSTAMLTNIYNVLLEAIRKGPAAAPPMLPGRPG